MGHSPGCLDAPCPARELVLFLFIAADVLFLVNVQASWHSVAYWLFHVPFVISPYSGLIGFARIVLWLVARFVLRGELLAHFNTAEPIGLRLNAFWTLLFGGLYLQFHFNQINRTKRTVRLGIPVY